MYGDEGMDMEVQKTTAEMMYETKVDEGEDVKMEEGVEDTVGT